MELILLFAIHKEKELVLQNWSADGASEIIQVELFYGAGKVALRIETRVAHKLVESPVKIVGTGFCRQQHRGSRPGPVLSRVCISQNLELLNVVDRRVNADTASSQLVIIDAIQQPVRTVRARAADRQRKRTACG